MPFDVFRLREHVVQEYRNYVGAFAPIRDGLRAILASDADPSNMRPDRETRLL